MAPGGRTGNGTLGAVILPIAIGAVFLLGCQSWSHSDPPPVRAVSTAPASFRVPPTMTRVAVFYPRASNKAIADAYIQLEGAVFQLKGQRPSLQIVERLDFPRLRAELKLQASGMISDGTAAHFGRLLGVEGIIFFDITHASPGGLFVSEFLATPTPVTITTKIIHVESGEVLFHNVVTTRIRDDVWKRYRFSLSPLNRMGLEEAVAQTIADLQRAFEPSGADHQPDDRALSSEKSP